MNYDIVSNLSCQIVIQQLIWCGDPSEKLQRSTKTMNDKLWLVTLLKRYDAVIEDSLFKIEYNQRSAIGYTGTH